MNFVRIERPKVFFQKLFVKSLFDDFFLNEITITAKNVFHIDGRIVGQSEKSGGITHSYWRDLKSICAQIAGEELPERMKLVLSLNPDQTARLLESGNIAARAADIGGLYINIKYEDNILTCVTGTSMKTFSTDRTLEHYFDKYTESFLIRIS